MIDAVNYCVPGLVPHLSSVLAPVPVWVPVTSPCPAFFAPGLAVLAAAVFGPWAPGRVAEAVLGAESPAVLGFSPAVLPVFPAELAPVIFVPPAAEYTGGLSCRVADNGNAGCVASAAALPGDTCLLNTAVGRQAVVPALEQIRASTGPIPCDAAPIHGPSVDPSGVERWIATRESTQEAAGSNARGYAG